MAEHIRYSAFIKMEHRLHIGRDAVVMLTTAVDKSWGRMFALRSRCPNTAASHAFVQMSTGRSCPATVSALSFYWRIRDSVKK